MDVRQISDYELEDHIDTFQHRIETVTEYISESGDHGGVLSNQLASYRQSLSVLRREQSRRRAAEESGNEAPSAGVVEFISTDHIRYENGRDVSGHNKGAKRGIRIEPNINGGEGYTLTLHNLDAPGSTWGDNVQMAPKQMRVKWHNDYRLNLVGFGTDSMGASFADYGMTVLFDGDEIRYDGKTVDFAGNKVKEAVLHMHDRGIDIKYLP